MGNLRLIDAHVHLGWFADPVAVAADAASIGLGMFCCTVGPEDRARAHTLLADAPNVRVGAGLHPWWVANEPEMGEMLERTVGDVRASSWVGEVGLDFGPRHVATSEAQLRCFRAVCEACADSGPKTISIHSVRAADAVLDIIEETGALASCRCVLHWFSGTSDELARARKAGCWFSLGEKSLATRRGREYARQIPAERLLLETDLPPCEGHDGRADEIEGSLGRAAEAVRALRPGWEPETQAGFLDWP